MKTQMRIIDNKRDNERYFDILTTELKVITKSSLIHSTLYIISQLHANSSIIDLVINNINMMNTNGYTVDIEMINYTLRCTKTISVKQILYQNKTVEFLIKNITDDPTTEPTIDEIELDWTVNVVTNIHQIIKNTTDKHPHS